MKRIQYHRYGGPEEMRLEAYELPAPGRDEIAVRVKAASVNPFDWKVRQGAMKFLMRGRFPRAMGTDFSGVVESVGAGVTRFRVGDEVLGTAPLAPAGAFAESSSSASPSTEILQKIVDLAARVKLEGLRDLLVPVLENPTS